MIIELRAFFTAILAFLVAITLVFFPWEVVFPAFAVLYAAYKYRYYAIRIGSYTSDLERDRAPSWRWLRAAIVVFLIVLVGARLTVLQGFPDDWIVSLDQPLRGTVLDTGPLDTESPDAMSDQLIPVVGITASIVVPLAVLSFVVAKFRRRLLVGVDSKPAAIRAALWESFARVPVYLTWASLATTAPSLVHWQQFMVDVQDATGLQIQVTGSAIAPVVDDFIVVMQVGHLLPVAVIGAFVTLQYVKYDGSETVPEVLGYRGLYAPQPRAELVNVVVPVSLLAVYAAVVVTYRQEPLTVGALLVVPVLVAVAVSANVRGTTTELITSPAGRIPGIGGDAVVTGIVLGLVLLVVLGASGVVSEAAPDPVVRSALLYPIVAAPLSYGANRAVSEYQARQIQSIAERVEENPDSLKQQEVDRLLVYVDDPNESLRRAAIDALGIAMWASAYRENDIMEVFVSAIDPSNGDIRFANEGLAGVVTLLRDNRAIAAETVNRFTEDDVLDAIEHHLDHSDPATREMAAEAYCRTVATGFERSDVSRPPLDSREGLPLEDIEGIVEDGASNGDLMNAAVECFAHLWYRRAEFPSRMFSHDDEQRILEALLLWSGDADEEARLSGAFAVTSGPASVDEPGLDAVAAGLDSDDEVVRYVAAHVLGSSMERHADKIDPRRLLATLGDEWPPARAAGAEALYAFVDHAPVRAEGFVLDIIDHLDRIDPARAGGAEATLLRALDQIDTSSLVQEPAAVATVAAYSNAENSSIADPASRLLASLVSEYPDELSDGPVVSALETGLTHESERVRANCVEAAAAIIEVDPGNGRPFVRGLTLNISETGQTGKTAVDALARVIDEYPGYGTEVIPEMVGGLRNPTPVDARAAGATITGDTVSEVTAHLVADITDEGVNRGEILIDPLVDLADHVEGSTHEAVFRALYNLTVEFPDEGRAAVGVATAGLEQGNARIRRLAASILSNVAGEYPKLVEPVVPNLVVAIDDNDARTRANALSALNNVVGGVPEAIEEDVRRIIGRVDDDSSIVRERAAEVLVTAANNEPTIVEPSAEAADRLRRLERDPAVEIDAETLQEAATAIQKGVAPDQETEAEGTPATSQNTEVFRVDEAGESGSSGDTRVYEPIAGDDDGGTFDGDTCPDCGADISDLGDLSICPECGTDLA